MAWVDPNINDYVAHLKEVRAVVRKVAEAGAARARENLAAHRFEGKMRIDVVHGRRTDSVVWLEDDDGGAVAAEMGRVTEGGTVVEPLNVLGEAFDL